MDVLPHPVFSRGAEDGADLYASVAISLEEALVGFTREIAALDGSVAVVRCVTSFFLSCLWKFRADLFCPLGSTWCITSFAEVSFLLHHFWLASTSFSLGGRFGQSPPFEQWSFAVCDS